MFARSGKKNSAAWLDGEKVRRQKVGGVPTFYNEFSLRANKFVQRTMGFKDRMLMSMLTKSLPLTNSRGFSRMDIIFKAFMLDDESEIWKKRDECHIGWWGFMEVEVLRLLVKPGTPEHRNSRIRNTGTL